VFYFGLINLHLDTSVNRFESQNLFSDRFLQYKYAFETLLQKPLFGFGLDKYAYINPELVPHYLKGYIIGAHNGYLAILVQYGIVFGLFIIGLIFYQTIKFYFKIEKEAEGELTYLYIIIYALLASFYESMITGINEFHTVLFWFALAFLSFSDFKKKHED
jgi:O-antigen ligase